MEFEIIFCDCRVRNFFIVCILKFYKYFFGVRVIFLYLVFGKYSFWFIGFGFFGILSLFFRVFGFDIIGKVELSFIFLFLLIF